VSFPQSRGRLKSGRCDESRLDPSEHGGGNRDYILRYRLDGDRIQSGLLLHAGERENFFLLMMQPPKRVSGDRSGARVYFYCGMFGLMHGFPPHISKKLLKNLDWKPPAHRPV